MAPSPWLLALLALPFLSRPGAALRHPGGHAHDQLPVCIVGAGPAGLAAAARLEQKNVSAVVFEREDQIAGKALSWYNSEGVAHPMGAAFYSRLAYPAFTKILDQVNVSSTPISLGVGRIVYSFDFQSGASQPFPEPTAQFTAAVAGEYQRYSAVWQERFAPLRGANFKNGVPEEFTVPFIDWLHAHNITAMPLLLVNYAGWYGYGDINIVPAVYMLNFYTPDILASFVQGTKVLYTDFHKVFVDWSKKALCNTPIHTSTDVRAVDRSGDHPVLTYASTQGSAGKSGKQQCSSVIFAFPPTISGLTRAGVNLTAQELEVFPHVTSHQYFSSAVETKVPYGVSYVAVSSDPTQPPPNQGEPVSQLAFDERSNVSIIYSWGPYNKTLDDSFVKQTLISTFSKINKDPRKASEAPTPLTAANVKVFRRWDYFPHFTSEALRGGAYAKLNKLQGSKKTYWASGGIAGFEYVEWAVQGGEQVADSYF